MTIVSLSIERLKNLELDCPSVIDTDIMEMLSTVKNHYNIDTVTGINVRQFVMKCNNVLTTENRADNCLEVTAVNFDPCSSVVDSTSCTIQLSAFEPPVSKHPTSVNTSYSSLMSVEVAPP